MAQPKEDLNIQKLYGKECTLSKEDFLEQEQKFYGIGYEEISKFEKIYRYYPYYSEGFFNT